MNGPILPSTFTPAQRCLSQSIRLLQQVAEKNEAHEQCLDKAKQVIAESMAVIEHVNRIIDGQKPRS